MLTFSLSAMVKVIFINCCYRKFSMHTKQHIHMDPVLSKAKSGWGVTHTDMLMMELSIKNKDHVCSSFLFFLINTKSQWILSCLF